MFERHQTKIAVFGGKPGENVQFKGMAGNQVLEWPDLDAMIKSVGLKDVSASWGWGGEYRPIWTGSTHLHSRF